jgi:hypothetical protein
MIGRISAARREPGGFTVVKALLTTFSKVWRAGRWRITMAVTAERQAARAQTLDPHIWNAQAPATTDAPLPPVMLARMAASKAASAAEALRELRIAFPDAPLPMRVAALASFRR